MSTTIIEALFEYFAACPLITDNRLNIDYLPEDTSQAGVEYSIGTTPANEVVRQYKDGGQLCRYVFVISSVNDYGPDTAQNMLNTGFAGETIGMDTPTVPNEKIARSAGWTISPTDQGAWSRLFICAGHQLGQIPNTM